MRTHTKKKRIMSTTISVFDMPDIEVSDVQLEDVTETSTKQVVMEPEKKHKNNTPTTVVKLMENGSKIEEDEEEEEEEEETTSEYNSTQQEEEDRDYEEEEEEDPDYEEEEEDSDYGEEEDDEEDDDEEEEVSEKTSRSLIFMDDDEDNDRDNPAGLSMPPPPPDTEALERLQKEIVASDAFDDVDSEQVGSYIEYLVEQRSKYEERMSAVQTMQEKVAERMRVLQSAESYLDFGRHPHLVDFFAERQKRLLKILQKATS